MSINLKFYYWPTPNGRKVSILLEELGITYETIFVNIRKGEQFADDFESISPNNRIPAIQYTAKNGEIINIFESGAIMLHLAEKYQKFLPKTENGKKELIEWLFWQAANQGPMAGQLSHFQNYAENQETSGYSFKRYENEYIRCLQVLESRLKSEDYLVENSYSIADIICWPWVLINKSLGISLENFPNVMLWRQKIKERPAVQKGVNLGREISAGKSITAEERKNLFRKY